WHLWNRETFASLMTRSLNAPQTTLGPVSPEPQLARPGAGLPKPELYVARILFALRRWTSTRDVFSAVFQKERHAIQQLVRSCGPVSAARRVLIPRVRGLEDSSRYWSVWMTLEHLRI